MSETNKMWASLIHLGHNMWGRLGMEYTTLPTGDITACQYHDKLYCDKEIWRKITDFMPSCGINTVLIDIGEGVKLDSHPELAIEGSWEKKDFIKELDRLRSIGLTPLPKFNFSCTHNGWMGEYAFKIGTYECEKMCVDVIKETIEMFGKPELFHLGLEEEVMEYQGCYPVRTVRSPEKLARDANMLFTACREEGLRPWMWVDPKSIEGYGGKEAFQQVIPKDVLISNWWYGWLIERFPGVHLYREIADWGYEQVPTSSTYENYKNEHHTLTYCKHYLENRGLKGYLTASWLPTMPDYIYGLMHDNYLFGQAKKELYPEEK